MKNEIPHLDLFMMCKSVNRGAFSRLPSGYSFRLCRPDELDTWKRLCVEKPEYVRYVDEEFDRVYAKRKDEFYQRCTFVRDENGRAIATCFLWKAYGKINTLHWLRVLP